MSEFSTVLHIGEGTTMSEDLDIGDHSRRFRLAVLLAAVFVLLTAVLAVAALDVSPGGLGLNGPNLFDQSGDGEQSVEPGEVTDIDGGGDDIGGGPGRIGGDGSLLPGFWDQFLIRGEPNGTAPPGDSFEGLLIDANISADWILDRDGDLPSEDLPEGGLPDEISPPQLPSPPYEIDVSPEPVPGNDVTVTVTKDGEPVPLVIVRFQGEPVGLTNLTGQTQATVPYVTELNVTAEPVEIIEDEPAGEDDSGGTLTTSAAGFGAAGGPVAQQDSPENSTATFSVSTDIEATPVRPPLPGEPVWVTIQHDGRSIPDLDVFVDGDSEGTTNASGMVRVQIPETAETGETVPLTAQRNEFEGQTALDIARIEMSIDPGLIAIPGAGVDVKVRAIADGQAVALDGVPVTLTDGDSTVTRQRTGEDGVARVGLPWSNSVTASATAYGTTVSASHSGILVQFALLLAVPLGLLVLAGALLLRNRDAVRGTKRRLVAALITVGEWLQRAGRRVVGIARAVGAALARAAHRLRLLLVGLLPSRSFSPLLWLLTRGRALRRRLLWLALAPLRWHREGSAGDRSASITAQPDQSTTDQRATAVEPTQHGAYERLLRAWRWLVRRVVGRSRTTTAIEVERRALDAGLPKRPVRRLRRAFQDVEYGYATAEERVESAEEAVDDLQEDEE